MSSTPMTDHNKKPISAELRRQLSGMTSVEGAYFGLLLAREALRDHVEGYSRAFENDTDISDSEKDRQRTIIEARRSLIRLCLPSEISGFELIIHPSRCAQLASLVGEFIAQRGGPVREVETIAANHDAVADWNPHTAPPPPSENWQQHRDTDDDGYKYSDWVLVVKKNGEPALGRYLWWNSPGQQELNTWGENPKCWRPIELPEPPETL